jgi:serine/threonine-protein kinase
MEVAHQRHIIHRDLKPANVLLARNGTAKITDFGLAKNLDVSSSQTKSGTLVGTPSYMAPEQARGGIGFASPAVDIHALGAMLYEMLVGRPPYLGASPHETTMQVLTQEPIRPSRLVPGLPADIETICLKCLQKEPAKRYPDAASLAEDCRRFLAGEPILSRPVSAPERLWRWCRRNPRVAGLAAAVAGLLVVVAAGSTIAALLVTEERNQKEIERKAAVESSRVAKAASILAAEREVAAETARREADGNARLATEQAGLALSTMQLLVDKVQTQLDDAPRTQKLKRELLETAIEGLKAVSKGGEGSTSIETTVLAAHMRMGTMFRHLGVTDEALREFEICHDIARRRALANPGNDASQANLAAVLTVLGDMHQELKRDMAASIDCHGKALKIWQQLRSRAAGDEGHLDSPTVAQNLAEASTTMAVTRLRLGDPYSALPLLVQALGLRRELKQSQPDDADLDADLARSCNAMAEVAFVTGQPDVATSFYEECLSLCQRLCAAAPDDPGSELELAHATGNYGLFRLRTHDLPAARIQLEQALECHRKLVALDGDVIEYQSGLAAAFSRLGLLETKEGNSDAARARFEDSRTIYQRIADIDPSNHLRQRELMLAVARCGDRPRAVAIAETLHADRADPELLVDLARCYAICSAIPSEDPATGESYARRALGALREACTAGYRDRISILTDPDLDHLHDRPGFAALTESIGIESPATPPRSGPGQTENGGGT